MGSWKREACVLSCSVASDSCDLIDCSLPGSSVHGILQARILEWVAFPFPEDLPNPGTETRSPALKADSLPTELRGKLRGRFLIMAVFHQVPGR